MTVNREMFAEIHKLITEFPELHTQVGWETNPQYTGRCGTTRCVAGWAVWLGAREHGLVTRKREMTALNVRRRLAERLDITQADIDAEEYLGGYPATDYPVVGARLLGLDDDQAHSLFHDFDDKRVAARVKSFAETGEDLPGADSAVGPWNQV